MQPFDWEVLLTSGVVIFFATLWVAMKVTRSVAFSLSAALLKAGVFFFYFGVLFDGTFTFLDDWGYLAGGQAFYARDVGVTNLGQNWEFALTTGGGPHFLYALYNTYALRFFGDGYYAPVALNIILATLIAWFGSHLAANEFGLAGLRKKMFFAFLLFHPDILAWSNVMNGKDTLVLLLHVLLLISSALLFRQRYISALSLAISVSLILFFTRFYVPVVFIFSLALTILLGKKVRGRVRLIFVCAALTSLVLMWFGIRGGLLSAAFTGILDNFSNPLFGLVHFVLTPIPFNTDLNYSFLDIPAFLHWLLFPFAIYGIASIYRLHTTFSRFFLLYIMVFVGLYAVFDQLQGPRQRMQMDYAWAILQFMGVMTFMRLAIAPPGQKLEAAC